MLTSFKAMIQFLSGTEWDKWEIRPDIHDCCWIYLLSTPPEPQSHPNKPRNSPFFTSYPCQQCEYWLEKAPCPKFVFSAVPALNGCPVTQCLERGNYLLNHEPCNYLKLLDIFPTWVFCKNKHKK